ncbi:MAG: type II toxin-antitoxin system VapC family toxin, partial [Mesorhizobium sp.]|nr:type II toxin-antitoxin system VapC family toxin [Mesorhizobium sp.]
SIAASWAIPDEDSATALRALDLVLRDGMLVPAVFWYEFRNVLIINERRGRLLVDETERALVNLDDLFPHTDAALPGEQAMSFARAHRLTIYDAAYLDLALRTGSSLATLDARLATAAAAEGIPVIA